MRLTRALLGTVGALALTAGGLLRMRTSRRRFTSSRSTR